MELTDSEIEASREALDETLEFIDSVEAACVHNVATLSMLGGNIYLGIPGVGAWTLVTRGPRAGLYPEATDDQIDFALICEEWVLHELLDPEVEIDLADYRDAGVFNAEGDFGIFQRLLTLAQGGGGMLDVRSRRE